MQYLYKDGETYYFMNNDNFEQLEVNLKVVKHITKYLEEQMNVTIVTNEGRIIDVVIPEKHVYEIIEADPSIKGDTKSGGDKTAKISTGHVIRVPLFIKVGERVIVNTTTGDYVSREK